MPRPDRSRAALVDTAAVLFRRQGYAATGVNQILDTADVKAGSLYHHFPNGKQELAAAAVDGPARHRAAAARVPRQRPAGGDIVDGWIDLMASGLSSDHRDGCPIEPIATESVNASPQVRDASARAFGGWCLAVADGFAATAGQPGSGPDRTRGDRAPRGRAHPPADRRRCRRTRCRQGGGANSAQPCRRSSRRELMPSLP